MALTTQFATVFAGDNPTIDITVNDSAGVAVNISSASAITWKVAVDEDTSPVITKTKAASDITLPNSGTDGLFRVATLTTDWSSLDGTYYQEAILTLAGNVVHVATGTIWVRPTIP